MNYLAHLYLAQPTADSHFGNLLGDFCRGLDTSVYSQPVLAGLNNHRRVDRFTDAHPEVLAAKSVFSRRRRRFAGIALDVLFDHFLIRHWAQYNDQAFDDFCQQAYARLERRLPMMPPRMQRVVSMMIQHHWMAHYRTLEGVGQALDRIADRIRFQHQFYGSVEELACHYDQLESRFLRFFPELVDHIDPNTRASKSV
ncbi:ACP phosphodiesterase [Saliniradius amylolyticus]|nr:ACP phosphodiesterase [Saliniradius amylolyticus]